MPPPPDPYGDVGGQLRRTGDIYEVTVMLNGEPESVWVDPMWGPRMRTMTENDVYQCVPMVTNVHPGPGGLVGFARPFHELGATDQEIGVIIAAKKNRAQRLNRGGRPEGQTPARAEAASGRARGASKESSGCARA
eukprot:CAMPEP_0171190370 /NCGR_PEP_ID=MMETSP0790-20130122/18822_1 /TAXON_ID=2925 /ORGANISM="Alexandrium catenella, Strain OF101" /LENGTH=135 /DNA_ID=CAMNT_0011655501 /DNA_START=99 /DNA_END=504 /DNA_ORIENTATION=-